MRYIAAAVLMLYSSLVHAQNVAPTSRDTTLARVTMSVHELEGRAISLFPGKEMTFEGDVAKDLRAIANRTLTRLSTAVDFVIIMRSIESADDRKRVGAVTSDRLSEMADAVQREIGGIDLVLSATKLPGTALIADQLRRELSTAVLVLRFFGIQFRPVAG